MPGNNSASADCTKISLTSPPTRAQHVPARQARLVPFLRTIKQHFLGGPNFQFQQTRQRPRPHQLRGPHNPRMQRHRQHRQQHPPRVGLNHRRFIRNVRRRISRMHAQDMALRLQRPPQTGRPDRRAAGNDRHIDVGIGKDFFQVADRTHRQAVPLQMGEAGGGSGVESKLMPTRRRQGAGEIQTIDVIAEECKTQRLSLLLEEARSGGREGLGSDHPQARRRLWQNKPVQLRQVFDRDGLRRRIEGHGIPFKGLAPDGLPIGQRLGGPPPSCRGRRGRLVGVCRRR